MAIGAFCVGPEGRKRVARASEAQPGVTLLHRTSPGRGDSKPCHPCRGLSPHCRKRNQGNGAHPSALPVRFGRDLRFSEGGIEHATRTGMSFARIAAVPRHDFLPSTCCLPIFAWMLYEASDRCTTPLGGIGVPNDSRKRIIPLALDQIPYCNAELAAHSVIWAHPRQSQVGLVALLPCIRFSAREK